MKYLDFSLIIFAFYFCSKINGIQPLVRNKILCRQDNKCGLCKKKFF